MKQLRPALTAVEKRTDPVQAGLAVADSGNESAACGNADISAEDEQLFEEREEIIESTEDAAEDAVPEGENDGVKTVCLCGSPPGPTGQAP